MHVSPSRNVSSVRKIALANGVPRADVVALAQAAKRSQQRRAAIAVSCTAHPAATAALVLAAFRMSAPAANGSGYTATDRVRLVFLVGSESGVVSANGQAAFPPIVPRQRIVR
jgi:hypothetical protein